VAGAGLAGLSAAWALERRGADVTIFEARQRVGGRVLTVRGLPGAAHAEIGGDLIEEGDRKAIGALAAEMGLALVRVLPGGFRYYPGRASHRGAMRSGREMFDGLRQRLAPEIAAFARAGEVPTSGIGRALAARTALEWAASTPRPAAAVAAVEALRGFFVAEPSEYSLLMLVQQLSEDGDPASMKLYRIAGGNARLAEALAGSLGRRPVLGARVVRVEGTRRLRVTVEGGARAVMRCDAVVIALPATLARRVEFAPALPPRQREAIDTLPYGRATKALVSFDRRFWRRRGHAFSTRHDTGAVWEAGAHGAGGTLAMLAGGDGSPVLASLVAHGSARDWRRALQWLGIGDARVTDVTAVTWESDANALGAYAFHPAGMDPALLPWLSAPSGRIAFAGEHTSAESQGYMEGAVMSGLRAADDIECALR
jgi:monoamine oxidase